MRRIHGAGRKLLALIDDIVRLSEGADEGGDEGHAVDGAPDRRIHPAAGAAAAAPVAGGRVLVVDDNETNRDMLCRRLERQGYTSLQAENGRRAARCRPRRTSTSCCWTS